MTKLHDFRTNFRFGRLKNGFRMRQDARSYQASVREAENMMIRSDQSIGRRWGTDFIKTLGSAKTRIEPFMWGVDISESNLLQMEPGQLTVLNTDGTVNTTFTQWERPTDINAQTITWDAAALPFIQVTPSGESVWFTDTTHPPVELKRNGDGTFSLSALTPNKNYSESTSPVKMPFKIQRKEVYFNTQIFLPTGYPAAVHDAIEAANTNTNTDVLRLQGYGDGYHSDGAFTGNNLYERFRYLDGEFEIIQPQDGAVNRSRIKVIRPLGYKLDTNPFFLRKDSTSVEIFMPPGHSVKRGDNLIIFGVTTDDATKNRLTKAIDIDGGATAVGTYNVDRIIDDVSIEITADSAHTADALVGGADVWIFIQNSKTDILQEPVWSDNYGWPQCSAVWQSRLWLGGATAFPDSVFVSATNDFEDFDLGTGEPNEGMQLLGVGGGGRVLHLEPGFDLSIFTSRGEKYVPGSVDVAVTPETVRAADAKTNVGSSYTPTVAFAGTIFHVDASGNHIRAHRGGGNQQFQNDNMTIGASDWVKSPVDSTHFFGGDIDATPYVLFVNDEDGSILVIHLMPEDDAFGAMRWTLGEGQFVSVAAMFNRLYAVVFFESQYHLVEFDTDRNGGNMDYAERFSGDSGNPTVTHSLLASRSVQATEDGANVLTGSVDVSGVYTKASAAADSVVVGLSMPWSMSVSPPVVATGQGPKAGKVVNLVDCEIMLRDTTTGTVEGESLLDQYDTGAVTDTRHYVVGKWEREALLEITGSVPGDFIAESLVLNAYF